MEFTQEIVQVEYDETNSFWNVENPIPDFLIPTNTVSGKRIHRQADKEKNTQQTKHAPIQSITRA